MAKQSSRLTALQASLLFLIFSCSSSIVTAKTLSGAEPLPAHEQQSFAKRMSVGECVTKVLHSNPNIEAAGQRIIQARARLTQARSTTGLFLDTDLGYITGDSPWSYLF